MFYEGLIQFSMLCIRIRRTNNKWFLYHDFCQSNHLQCQPDIKLTVTRNCEEKNKCVHLINEVWFYQRVHTYIIIISFNILMTDTDKTLITSNLNHSHRCWIVPIKATKWIFFDFVQKIKHKTTIKEFIFTWQMVEIVDNAQHTHKKTTTTTTMTVFRSQWWMCVI